VLHLADGGVYDNSGMLSAVKLFRYLSHACKKEVTNGCRHNPVTRLVLLSINADTTTYDLDYAARVSTSRPWYERIPIKIDWPIRTGLLDSVWLVHYTNKRRGEELALDELREITGGEASDGQPKVVFFPVNLLQLSEFDAHAIKDGESVFDLVRDINTNYTVSSDDDNIIAQAAHKLISSSQEQSWPVGPECEGKDKNGKDIKMKIHRLDDAFAFALLRAQQTALSKDHMYQQGWDDRLLIPGTKSRLYKRWCATSDGPKSNEDDN
jgi:hypothetical protein